MIGEFECVNDVNYIFSMVCDSLEGTVYRWKKDDVHKFLSNSEDSLKMFKHLSRHEFESLHNIYMQKIE